MKLVSDLASYAVLESAFLLQKSGFKKNQSDKKICIENKGETGCQDHRTQRDGE